MNLAGLGEECEEDAPYANEECNNEDGSLSSLEVDAPQGGPVLAVGLGKGALETSEAKDQIRLTPLSQ